MSKYIIANWKSNPQNIEEVEKILVSLDSFFENRNEPYLNSLVICPPSVFIQDVSLRIASSNLIDVVSLGSQDIDVNDEDSVNDLISYGVEYVIIGHSDRRYKLNESSEVINSKLKKALELGIKPIVCLGELKREIGFEDILRNQIKDTFSGLNKEDIAKCLIAYEPVWAISTTPDAKPDSPDSALVSIKIIKEVLGDVKVLYGGSVNGDNAYAYLDQAEIAGVLVGRASLNPDQFIKIVESV